MLSIEHIHSDGSGLPLEVRRLPVWLVVLAEYSLRDLSYLAKDWNLGSSGGESAES